MKNPYLVIIDVQEKLYPVMHDHETLLNNLCKLVKGFHLFELPILITEQAPHKLGETIDSISNLFIDFDPIIKSSFSCAGDPDFIKKSSNLSADGIVLAGIETHVCIYQTERDLIRRGHHVEVVTDAVRSRDPINHNIALDRIRNNGGFLTTVEMILFNIQENAKGDRFRELVKIVK